MNPNPTEKSMVQKKKIMLHKTKEHATDVIPTPPVESWEEKIEEILDKEIIGDIHTFGEATNQLKQFISTQIQQAEAKVKEFVSKNMQEYRRTKNKAFLLNVEIYANDEILATLKEEKDL